MKYFRMILLLLLLLIAVLSGCSATHTVEIYGKKLTVDMEQGTIFDGTYTYQYTVSR